MKSINVVSMVHVDIEAVDDTEIVVPNKSSLNIEIEINKRDFDITNSKFHPNRAIFLLVFLINSQIS